MRGLEKNYRHTYAHTDGHCDYYTNLAKRAHLVKMADCLSVTSSVCPVHTKPLDYEKVLNGVFK